MGLCDLVSARVLKPTAERLRPSHRVEFVDSITFMKERTVPFIKVVSTVLLVLTQQITWALPYFSAQY